MSVFESTTPGSGSWAAPAAGTITVEAWGGGGGGSSNYGEGGAGGGAYSRVEGVAVAASEVVAYTVGAGGVPGVDGEPSSVGGVCIAPGGETSTGKPGGAGGDSAGATGDVTFSGGNGTDAVPAGRGWANGQGGSSAGIAANGTSSINNGCGGVAPEGGGNGAGSGGGANYDAKIPGGGGACLKPGATGKIRITFTAA